MFLRRLRQEVSWVGHRVREASVHVDRLTQDGRLPRVAYCVGDSNNGMSSGLRGYLVARKLRKYGWRTIVIPKQLELSQRLRLMKLEAPDIVVLQKSRHPLNRPKHFAGSACIFDIDDADFVDARQSDGVIECLTESAHVVAGSQFIAEFARKHNPNVDIVWTGSCPAQRSMAVKEDPPIVAWAVSSANSYPAEMALVTSALSGLKGRNWQFWLFGVIESEGVRGLISLLRSRGIRCQTIPFLDYGKFLKMLGHVSIGLAPLVPSESAFSAGKSFGKVLGYLNCRVAIVASDCGEHPRFFENGVNGFLASNSEGFSQAIELLLSDRELRAQVSDQAHRDYKRKLSIEAVARKTDAIFRGVMANRGPIA